MADQNSPRNYSPHQQKIIKRFYNNRDQLDEQRLSELVADLYLASEAKKKKLWANAGEMMKRLGVPDSRIDHVISSAKPEILAEVVKDLQSGKIAKAPSPVSGSPPTQK
ncbi:MAG: hypothetical protein O2955_07240 [Planctomycetota bacterium]|nr:hypothetical protein [Planctomycetota bacterium]MDA1212292.1 hypothetical protein [Planctomycetota bacterium]